MKGNSGGENGRRDEVGKKGKERKKRDEEGGKGIGDEKRREKGEEERRGAGPLQAFNERLPFTRTA